MDYLVLVSSSCLVGLLGSCAVGMMYLASGKMLIVGAAVMSISAYVFVFLTNMGLGFTVGAALGTGVTILIGCLFGWLSRVLETELLLFISIATSEVIYRTTFVFRNFTGGSDGTTAFSLLQYDRQSLQIFVVMACIVVGLLIVFFLRSRAGHIYKFMGEDSFGARIIGVNESVLSIQMGAILGLLLGFAGVLFAVVHGFLAPQDLPISYSLQMLVVGSLLPFSRLLFVVVGTMLFLGPEVVRVLPIEHTLKPAIREMFVGAMIIVVVAYTGKRWL